MAVHNAYIIYLIFSALENFILWPPGELCGVHRVRTGSRLSMWYGANIHWPRVPRLRFAAARFMGLRVRIQPWAWMSVCGECLRFMGEVCASD